MSTASRHQFSATSYYFILTYQNEIGHFQEGDPGLAQSFKDESALAYQARLKNEAAHGFVVQLTALLITSILHLVQMEREMKIKYKLTVS